MAFTLTREQLYELVWSEPMQRLGKQIGISDVAIAKHCRKIGVPLPPRGYWNKLHAGKRVVKAELQTRDLATVNEVEMSGELSPELRARLAGEPGVVSAQDEDIEVLKARFAARLGTVTIPRLTTKTHPVVAQLLRKDEEIRQEMLKRTYYWEKPQFESAIERRRLRIINAIFLAAARVGGSGYVQGKRAEELRLRLGGNGVGFTLEKFASGKRRNPADDKSEALCLRLSREGPALGMLSEWHDGETRLEQQLTEIVVGMAVAGEHFHRYWIAQKIEWERQRREELERFAIEQRREAERRKREQVAAIEKAKVDALRADAAAWREAKTIRAYIAAARIVAPGQVDTATLDRWASWANAEATKLDPLISERLTTSIRNLDVVPDADDGDDHLREGDEIQ